MDIRKASQADKENIARLHIASIRRLCCDHYGPTQLESWTSVLVPDVYDQALAEKYFLVACDPHQNLLGMGIFDIDHAEISAIYVHPDHVGKGVGATLLHEFEKVARDHDTLAITVYATLNARGFYQSNGYREQETTFHTLPNGSRLECIRMLKNL